MAGKGKAIGRSLSQDQKLSISENLASYSTSDLRKISEKLEEAQHWPEECWFEGIDFSKITPASIRWAVKEITNVLKEREAEVESYFSEM